MIPSLFFPEKKIDKCLEKLTKDTLVSFASINIETLKSRCNIQGERALVGHFLTASENEKYVSFAYNKRKMEWLAGRIAAKHATIKLFSPSCTTHIERGEWKKWEVAVEANGRPLMVSNHWKPDISISHSGGIAVSVAVKEGACGVDIQKISPKVVTVEKKFINNREKEFKKKCVCLNRLSDEQFLTLIWSAKEALRKGSGHKPVIGFLEMELCLVNKDLDFGLEFQFSCTRELGGNQKKIFTTRQNICGDFAVSCLV